MSIRTLQYYDRIGLLSPTDRTEAGYRLYDDAALEKLQQILLFRELEFPLKDIMEIVNRPDFDRSKALEQQIELLKLKKEHIENLIDLAAGIKLLGVKALTRKGFEAFDTRKIELTNMPGRRRQPGELQTLTRSMSRRAKTGRGKKRQKSAGR